MLLAECPEHASCSAAWEANAKRVIYCHGLLETFSQLTGGRLGKPVAPDVAAKCLRLNMQPGTVQIVELDSKEVLEHLGDARRLGIRGGAVYDYMHICAARKAGADRIFTLNIRHFHAIAPDLANQIRHPADIHGQ